VFFTACTGWNHGKECTFGGESGDTLMMLEEYAHGDMGGDLYSATSGKIIPQVTGKRMSIQKMSAAWENRKEDLRDFF